MLFDLGCMMVFHDDAEGIPTSTPTARMKCLTTYGRWISGRDADLRRPHWRHAPAAPGYAHSAMCSQGAAKDAQEVLDVVTEYRRREVPLDVIVLDWQSWPERVSGGTRPR